MVFFFFLSQKNGSISFRFLQGHKLCDDLGQLLFIDLRSSMETKEPTSVEDLYGLGIVPFFFVLLSWEGCGGRGS